jgi:hypothetical protein
MVNGNVSPVVHITFVKPSYDGGSVITGYKYFIKPDTSDTYREVEKFNQVTDHSVDIDALLLKNAPWVLRDGSEIFAKVVAVNAAGEAMSTAGSGGIYEIPCQDGVAPDSPVDLREMTITGRTITFSWRDPKCNGGSDIRNYVISYQKAGEQAMPDQVYAGKDMSYTIENVVPASTYEVKIAAQSS